MNYADTIAYLFNLQFFGVKLGLKNISTLLECLGNPHKNLKCIHIAGTNGKGSTAAFLQSILMENGYRAGLYTSPHLIDFIERIRIDRKTISKAGVCGLTKNIRSICRKNGLEKITFFEFVTAMAFCWFAEQKVDVAILETGLGGTYDATNVVQPLLSIITSIGLDHQKYLGRTLAEIARDKGGIIKRRTPVVCGAEQSKIKELYGDICKSRQSPLHLCGRDFSYRRRSIARFSYAGPDLVIPDVQAGLLGAHQVRNATLAIAAAELLRLQGFSLEEQRICKGIARAFWPGRAEVINTHPTVILDGAHNPAAWKALKKTLLETYPDRRIIFIIGVLEDKPIGKLVNALHPIAHAMLFTKPDIHRAADRTFNEKFIRFSARKRVLWIANPLEALEKALAMASDDDIICVTGSLFVVGEIRQKFSDRKTAAPSGRIGL